MGVHLENVNNMPSSADVGIRADNPNCQPVVITWVMEYLEELSEALH
jgi:hypothetical protein